MNVTVAVSLPTRPGAVKPNCTPAIASLVRVTEVGVIVRAFLAIVIETSAVDASAYCVPPALVPRITHRLPVDVAPVGVSVAPETEHGPETLVQVTAPEPEPPVNVRPIAVPYVVEVGPE